MKIMNPLCFLALIVVSFSPSIFANHIYPEATQFQQQRNAMVDTLSQKYRGLGLAVQDVRVLIAMVYLLTPFRRWRGCRRARHQFHVCR